MDLPDMGVLISGLVLGAIGTGLFMYGKKQTDFRCIATGIALCIFPYFIGSVLVTWLVGAGLIGGLWAWCRVGGQAGRKLREAKRLVDGSRHRHDRPQVAPIDHSEHIGFGPAMTIRPPWSLMDSPRATIWRCERGRKSAASGPIRGASGEPPRADRSGGKGVDLGHGCGARLDDRGVVALCWVEMASVGIGSSRAVQRGYWRGIEPANLTPRIMKSQSAGRARERLLASFFASLASGCSSMDAGGAAVSQVRGRGAVVEDVP